AAIATAAAAEDAQDRCQQNVREQTSVHPQAPAAGSLDGWAAPSSLQDRIRPPGPVGCPARSEVQPYDPVRRMYRSVRGGGSRIRYEPLTVGSWTAGAGLGSRNQKRLPRPDGERSP